MYSLFKTTPIVDENTAMWLFDAYQWALEYYDADVFFNETTLITPTNDNFPGTVSSVAEMSNAIFDKIKQAAFIDHWPIRLVQPEAYMAPSTYALPAPVASRTSMITADKTLFPVSYNAAQINKPQDLIANLTVQSVHYVASNINQTPPGGSEFWPQAVELLSIYFGFGIMFANSAYTFRGGCGSCYNQAANRETALPESESIFALAIFCHLKNIPLKQAATHLKPYLRKMLKNAFKDIKTNHQDSISMLRLYAPKA